MDTDTGANAHPAPNPKRKRRWLQFSLRTLLVLGLVVSVPSGWFACKLKQAREQQEAVRAIEKLGGSVTSCSHGSSDMIPNVVACLGRLLGVDLLTMPPFVTPFHGLRRLFGLLSQGVALG